MKGDKRVIDLLNQVLKAELTSINQYFLHAEMCENWGYYKLSSKIKRESIDEMRHAEQCMERILYLEGTPNMSDYFRINIGKDVPEQLKNDLELEYDAVKRLNDGVKIATDAGDHGTRDMLVQILKNEEEHVDWLEAQLQNIQDVGLQNYLAKQMNPDAASDKD
ncbi:MAG TPA: bacterioferritin [Terriglobales bacterium]|nr:bacterioferritin [Terriglobales bacterium]